MRINLKIKTRLMLVPILSAVIFLFGGFEVFDNLQKIIVISNDQRIIKDELLTISKVPLDLGQIRYTVGEILLGEDVQNNLAEARKSFSEDALALKSVFLDGNGKEKAKEDKNKSYETADFNRDHEFFVELIEAESKSIETQVDAIIAAFDSGDAELAKELFEKADADFDGFNERIAEMTAHTMTEAQLMKEASDSVQRKVKIIIVALFVLVVLLSLFLALFHSNRIATELKDFQAVVNEILGGNLEKRIAKGNGDEIDQLGQAFNMMIGKVEEAQKTLEEKVRKRTEALEEANATVEEKVRAQTQKLRDQNIHQESMQKAVLNILDDVSRSEKELRSKTDELEKAAAAIELQRERAEGVLRFLRSIGDGVIATDMEGKVIFINEAAEKMTGVSDENALGKHIYEVTNFYQENNPQEQIKIVMNFLTKSRKLAEMHERAVLKGSKDGVINVSLAISYIYNNNKEKEGCIVVIHDITEERELEKTKDKFLSVASHQLRTPLSGIRWYLEMLLNGDAGKLTKEAHEIVSDISENNLRMIELVDELLNVSRINMGKSMTAPEPVPVVKSIAEAIKELKGLAEKNKIKVVFDEKKNADACVLFIKRRFFEVVDNLLSNALKYSKPKGAVKIKVEKKENKLEISVADSGIGIPKKDQVKIFSKFFRASNAALKETDGSGLGLNVAKSFVEEANGQIYFESHEGEGTTFLVELPLSETKES